MMPRSFPDTTALVADNNVRYMALQALAVLTQINIQVLYVPVLYTSAKLVSNIGPWLWVRIRIDRHLFYSLRDADPGVLFQVS
jgi:hypothetical protein